VNVDTLQNQLKYIQETPYEEEEYKNRLLSYFKNNISEGINNLKVYNEDNRDQIINIHKQISNNPNITEHLFLIIYKLKDIDERIIKREKINKNTPYLDILDKLGSNDKQIILKNHIIQQNIAILYGYLTNPFQVIIGVTNTSKLPNRKIQSDKMTNKKLLCELGNNCEQKEIKLGENNYKNFDNIYLPTIHQVQYKSNTNTDTNTSLHEVAEINSLITRFNNENGKNFMLMHYGYSGTGKTNVAQLIHNKIIAINGIDEETRITYGKRGILNDQSRYIDGSASSDYESSTFEGNNNHTNITKKITKTDIITDKNTNAIEYDIESGIPITLSSESKIPYLDKSKLYKPSLNNPKSSRFHLCRVYTNNNKGNKLYFFDLAGFESTINIIKQFIPDFGEKNDEKNDDYIEFKNLFTNSVNTGAFVDIIYFSNFTDAKKLGNVTNLFKSFEDKKWYKYLFHKKKVNNKNVTVTIHDIRDRFDLLMESYYIISSLQKLKKELKKFKQNYNIDNIPRIQLPDIGLTESVQFEKIVLYGFIRSDIGYKDGDTTFEDGNKKTLDFLNEIMEPTNQNKTKQAKPNGGKLLRDKSSLFENMALVQANKLSEQVFDKANQYMSEGGGILDQSVLDTDRAMLVAITFVISVVSVHIKKMLVDKGLIKDKKHSVVVMLLAFSLFTLLYISIIRLQTIDVIYICIYLLFYAIINLAINIFQVDDDTKKALMLHKKGDNQIIEDTYYNQNETNFLLTWAISSIGIIFI
jgi:hypothetical protein